tara:strand:+ start:236 stop:460 length:225 start_codon:yes stop_codon:yes gene_type:complete
VEFPVVAFLVVASLVLGSRVVIIVDSTVLVVVAYLHHIGLLPFVVVDLGHSSQTRHPKYKNDWVSYKYSLSQLY